MAVAFGSVATTVWATSDGITINKPSGLALGELMVAHIVVEGAGSPNDITLTGWTLIVGFDDSEVAAILWKFADSGDVAATNFTFNTDGSHKCGGAIYRFTGGSNAFVAGTYDTTSTTTSHVFDTADITPTTADSMILFLFHTYGGAVGVTSAYAIATSDPTWTEAYDFSNDTGTDMCLSSAYAVRTAVTSTGDASCTTTGTTNGRAVLVAIAPRVDATVTPNVLSVPVVLNASTLGVSFSPNVISIGVTANTPVAANPTPDWVNQDKETNTWTDQTKS